VNVAFEQANALEQVRVFGMMHAVDGDALEGAAWTSHNVFLYDT